MAEETDDSDKTEEPSAYRIEEFRKRGEVASSRELSSVLILFACMLAMGISIVSVIETLSHYIEWLYNLDFSKAMNEKLLKTIAEKTALTALKCAAPVCLTALIVGVFSSIIQFGFLFSPEILEIKWERVDPIAGIKRLFSFRAALEALKGLLKFIIILAVTWNFLKNNQSTYIGFLHQDFFHSFLKGKDLLVSLAMWLVAGLSVVAILDFAYQKISYHKRLMLSRDEAKREHKEHEGNPEIKQRIKNIQRQMAQKRMSTAVPKADVIVTNPTHLSVALRYDKDNMVSPEVIAKGADHLALKIREIAKQHNIPIVENVPLARSLYKSVKVGGPVPRNLYKAVAEVLAFVYKMKRSQKALM